MVTNDRSRIPGSGQLDRRATNGERVVAVTTFADQLRAVCAGFSELTAYQVEPTYNGCWVTLHLASHHRLVHMTPEQDVFGAIRHRVGLLIQDDWLCRFMRAVDWAAVRACDVRRLPGYFRIEINGRFAHFDYSGLTDLDPVEECEALCAG